MKNFKLNIKDRESGEDKEVIVMLSNELSSKKGIVLFPRKKPFVFLNRENAQLLRGSWENTRYEVLPYFEIVGSPSNEWVTKHLEDITRGIVVATSQEESTHLTPRVSIFPPTFIKPSNLARIGVDVSLENTLSNDLPEEDSKKLILSTLEEIQEMEDKLLSNYREINSDMDDLINWIKYKQQEI